MSKKRQESLAELVDRGGRLSEQKRLAENALKPITDALRKRVGKGKSAEGLRYSVSIEAGAPEYDSLDYRAALIGALGEETVATMERTYAKKVIGQKTDRCKFQSRTKETGKTNA